MRKLILLVALLVTIGNAKAAVYAVDPLIGRTSFVACQDCANISKTQLYTFAPGDTVDFGTLTLGWSLGSVGPDLLAFPPGFLTVSFGPIPLSTLQTMSALIPHLICDRTSQDCSNFLPNAVTVLDLSFTLPDNATQIQVAWSGSVVSYIPSSVPEPSTWAMLLIGFAGIGFAGFLWPKHTGDVLEVGPGRHGLTTIMAIAALVMPDAPDAPSV
jgi:hypothetical protein